VSRTKKPVRPAPRCICDYDSCGETPCVSATDLREVEDARGDYERDKQADRERFEVERD
jgi:hypothetical protein